MKLKHAQKVNALLAAMVLVGGTALAADNTTTATTAEAAYTLPNVVVTATRTPESTLTVPATVLKRLMHYALTGLTMWCTWLTACLWTLLV